MKKLHRVRTPTFIQIEAVECGAVSLSIILGYYGRFVPLEEMRIECGVSRDGSKASNIVSAAQKYGLKAEGSKKTVEELQSSQIPAIIFWNFKHFLVLEGFGKGCVYINDPATGPRKVSYDEFASSYSGIVLTFEPEEQFKKGGSRESLIKHLYERLKKIPGSLSFLILTGFCLLLPGFAMPAFLMVFIDTFFTKFILPWDWEFLSAVLFTLIFTAAVTWIQQFFLNRLDRKLSISFSSSFLWHLLQLPSSFYAQRYTAEIAYRTSLNDIVARTLTGPVTSTFINLCLIIFYALVMFTYDVVIASIGIVAGIINLVSMYYIFRFRKNAYACLQQDISKSAIESIGGLQHMETIKAKGIESDFFAKWSGVYTKNNNSNQSIGKMDVFLSTVPVLFRYLTVAVLLGVGCIRIIEGNLTIGKLMALQLLMTNFLKPINLFVSLSMLIQNMKVDIERLNDVIKNKPDEIYIARRNKQKENINKLSGKLEFKNVTFHYSSFGPPVVSNLSFVIHPGKKLALVGMTGSGKSTIAKLAAGIYYPSSGEILYDGIPIQDLSIELFSDSIAMVDQEIFLFQGTIRENITLWNQKIPDEILLHAAKDAVIHEDILMRPGGYDAPLIERGGNLSGGQRQRIEIARALLYNPTLLMLDEATSALDTKTEEIVLDRIRQRGCSVLMIAHRLSTIQDCEEIIVLDKGVPIQRGTHEELKTQQGKYKELIESEVPNG